MAVALGLGLGLAGAAGAEPAAEAGEATPSALRATEGRITAVDTDRGTVTLAGEGAALEVRVDAATTIFLGGRVGRLTDLAEGQRVRAAFEARDGAPVAQWIELAPAG